MYRIFIHLYRERLTECWQACSCPCETIYLFSIERCDYLVSVDCYSTLIEVDCLTSTMSEVVINKLKQHIARYGIPDTIILENDTSEYDKPTYPETFIFCVSKWVATDF